MKKVFNYFLILSFLFVGFTTKGISQTVSDHEVVFVFMTDIHVQLERNPIEGFKKAIEKVNDLNPDFIITGSKYKNSKINLFLYFIFRE